MSNIDPAMSSAFFQEGNTGERDNTIPRFYLRPVQNEFKSASEGRPIFEDREYVEIIIPGNRGTVVDRPVRPDDRVRWPRHYAFFKSEGEMLQEGTPLEEWPAISRSQVEELKFFNVRTVETLAGLDDQGLARACPQAGHALRAKAQAFIAQAKDGAGANALAAKQESQEATIAAQAELIRQMTERLESLEKPKEPGTET